MLYIDLKPKKKLKYYLCSLLYDNKIDVCFDELKTYSKSINMDFFALSYNYIFQIEKYFLIGTLEEIPAAKLRLWSQFMSGAIFEYSLEMPDVMSFYAGLKQIRKYFKSGNKVICPLVLKDYYGIIHKVYTKSMELYYYFPIKREPYTVTVDFQYVFSPLTLVEVINA